MSKFVEKKQLSELLRNFKIKLVWKDDAKENN